MAVAAAQAVVSPAGIAQLAAMLGQPAIVGHVAPFGMADGPSMLQVPAALAAVPPRGLIVLPPVFGVAAAIGSTAVQSIIALPPVFSAVVVVARQYPTAQSVVNSVLGSARMVGFTDYTAFVDPVAPTYYVADFVTPGGAVRLPVSSWQATLQTGQQSYVQCVVPGVLAYVDEINSATSFSITRRAALLDGDAVEEAMAAAPISFVQFAQGTANYTANVNGYAPGFVAGDALPPMYDRRLAGIRTIFGGAGGYRVRCAIDWLLRPTQRAFLNDETPFTVSFISYYVGRGDAYMDIGQRVEE
jgi:hypothetical protein